MIFCTPSGNSTSRNRIIAHHRCGDCCPEDRPVLARTQRLDGVAVALSPNQLAEQPTVLPGMLRPHQNPERRLTQLRLAVAEHAPQRAIGTDRTTTDIENDDAGTGILQDGVLQPLTFG